MVQVSDMIPACVRFLCVCVCVCVSVCVCVCVREREQKSLSADAVTEKIGCTSSCLPDYSSVTVTHF